MVWQKCLYQPKLGYVSNYQPPKSGTRHVGVMTDMSGMQYSVSYGENFFCTSSAHAPLVDKNTAVELSVSHTAMPYLEEHYNDRTTNVSTR